MTREELKNIWILTTSKMPVFNYDDKRFDYYVGILGETDRLNMIRQTLKDENYDSLINERNGIIEYFDNKFNEMNIEKKLLSVKLTYPRWFIEKDEKYIAGNKCVNVDLKEAAFNVLKHFGFVNNSDWSDLIGEATNNSFLRNNDDTLKLRALYGEHYVPNGTSEYEAYNLCYKQMLYECYSGGLNQFMEEHGCIYSKMYRDALRYDIVDESKFESFKTDWGDNMYKIFNNIETHYYIKINSHKKFYLPDHEKKVWVNYTVDDDGKYIVSSKSDEHFPQFKKLIMGLSVTDDDLYYMDNNKKTALVQIL